MIEGEVPSQSHAVAVVVVSRRVGGLVLWVVDDKEVGKEDHNAFGVVFLAVGVGTGFTIQACFDIMI